MKILVMICARGGSKGVPGKHTRNLYGKPLIRYAIDHAIGWGKADAIILSSDSSEILSYATLSFADQAIIPISRPDTLAQDDTPKIPVIRHAWRVAESLLNIRFDVAIDLDATAPLREVEDIEGCLQAFLDGGYLTLFSVCHGPNPRFNMVEWKPDGTLNLCIADDYWHKGIRCRQGIKQEAYCVNSNIYVYSREFFEDETLDSCLVPDRTGIYVMHKRSIVHIDSEQDWEVVETIIRGQSWISRQ